MIISTVSHDFNLRRFFANNCNSDYIRTLELQTELQPTLLVLQEMLNFFAIYLSFCFLFGLLSDSKDFRFPNGCSLAAGGATFINLNLCSCFNFLFLSVISIKSQQTLVYISRRQHLVIEKFCARMSSKLAFNCMLLSSTCLKHKSTTVKLDGKLLKISINVSSKEILFCICKTK